MNDELKIDKENFTATLNNLSLSKKKKFEVECKVCGKLYQTCLGSEFNKTKKTIPWACKRCCLRKAFATRQTADPSKGLKLDRTEPCKSTDIDNNLLGYYQFFKTNCVSCNNEYETCITTESNKKHKWTCHSCAIKEEWKGEDYRNVHQEKLKEAANRIEVKESQSKNSISRWNDPDCRKRMIENHKQTCDDLEWKKVASERCKNWWLQNSNRNTFKSRKQGYYQSSFMNNKVWLRSSYELKMAVWLDQNLIKWEYETKSYLLDLENKCKAVYVPDFYILDHNITIEVKGYFYQDALIKWNAFCDQYCDLKKLLVRQDQIFSLREGQTIEDLINSCGGYSTRL